MAPSSLLSAVAHLSTGSTGLPCPSGSALVCYLPSCACSLGSTMGHRNGCGLGPARPLLFRLPPIFSLAPSSFITSLDSVCLLPPPRWYSYGVGCAFGGGGNATPLDCFVVFLLPICRKLILLLLASHIQLHMYGFSNAVDLLGCYTRLLQCYTCEVKRSGANPVKLV